MAQNAIYFLRWLFQIIKAAQKAMFSFSRRPEMMVFPKKLRWNMIFLLFSGKVIFLFPENMIIFLVRKMKDDLSQENTRRYIFFKCYAKMVFSIRIAQRHYLSCTIWKNGIFFPKTWYFFLGRKMRDDFSQEIRGNMIFSLTWRQTPPAK